MRQGPPKALASDCQNTVADRTDRQLRRSNQSFDDGLFDHLRRFAANDWAA
jgi:hypothetical protein